MQKEKDDCVEVKKRTYSILTPDELALGRKPCRTGIEVVGCVRNLSPKLWAFDTLTSLYMTDCSINRLPPEISNLKRLKYLDLSRNKLRNLPSELGDMIKLRELILNNNCLRVIPNELGRLFQLRVLGLEGNPLPTEILNLAMDSANINKLLGMMLSNLTVCPRPPERGWISLTGDTTKSTTDSFTVMSFNVLFDKYCTLQQYGYCPSWALQWEKRKTDVLKDIMHYSADIIGLQEVGTEQFNNFFLPELRQHGYEGIFSPKSRAKTMLEDERRHVDGCAIFWNTSKFCCLKEHLVEFNQLAAAHAEGADDMLNRVMTRDNIGIMALLETVPEFGSKQHHVVVANAHIHWDPEYRDVKLIQTVMLMNEVERFFEEMIASEGGKNGFSTQYDQIPFIMCADLNSLPDSGVIEFLESGKIPINHDDFQQLAYDGFLSRCSVASGDNGKTSNELSHPFHLRRSYADVDMPFTDFTYDFAGVLDYIFYTGNSLSLHGALGPVDQQYIEKNKIIGFPHPHFPSDHISLVVELDFNASSMLSHNGMAAGPLSSGGYPR